MMDTKAVAEILKVSEADVRRAAAAELIFGNRYNGRAHYRAYEVERIRKFLGV